MRLLLCAALLAALGMAADSPDPLPTAATKGQTAQVKSLLAGGANIETVDRNGRTPLMLAAQHGHLETVRLLLARGAKPDARDNAGYTAWALTMFGPVGHGDHEGVLKALPQPKLPGMGIEASWSPGKLASSCFMNREQLVWHVRDYRLDSVVLDDFARYASSPAAKGLVEIDGAVPLGMSGDAGGEKSEAGALVDLDVQPGAACAGQSDNLTLSIGVRVFRARDHTLLFERSFAGGVKGLRMQPVDNPRQYEPVWESWIKPQVEPMYWEIASALARATP